ncbi:MAG TPA: hypothetical protein VMU99_07075 [Acidimicrobiales bacterium]|nr:hypothetical protein [Acidimicrobiales bacterium]
MVELSEDEGAAGARRKIASRLPYSAYELWMHGEGIPIYEGWAIEDITAVERTEWKRLGGNGAFFHLRGMDGFTLAYVIDIQPGAELNWQKHLYQESVYVLEGSGVMEIETPSGPHRSREFSWKKGTLLAPTVNSRYQLRNTSQETALLYVVTDAPMIMDLYHNLDFIFNSDYVFADRLDALSEENEVRSRLSERGGLVIQGNQIHDVDHLGLLDSTLDGKGGGVKNATYEMAGNTLAGHLAQESVRTYDRAHYHGGGATILHLKSDVNERSHGYTLLWPPECGEKPYQNGFADKVLRVDWKPGSILSPPTCWYHEHFNLGQDDDRNIAFRFGYANVFGTRFYASTHDVDGRPACIVPSRLGGSMIDWPDEDPQIHDDFHVELAAEGANCAMDHKLFAFS